MKCDKVRRSTRVVAEATKASLECDRSTSLNTNPLSSLNLYGAALIPRHSDSISIASLFLQAFSLQPLLLRMKTTPSSSSQISTESALPSSTSNFLSLLTKFPFLYHNIHLHLSQSRLRFNTP
ncbi:unnamed protein product [Vicia faba]|uniref:Uncharacterized protein n=1 Tax=Vicia faba TaxID=3906 RepID=A0AAV1B4I6_VICFA|nr:unnamed protein product [Vicia faba]